jgi:hypothetical protein
MPEKEKRAAEEQKQLDIKEKEGRSTALQQKETPAQPAMAPQATPTPTGPPSDIKEAADSIKQKVALALDKKPNATISINKEGDTWRADVEVVEEEYLPGQNIKSMNDILGLYDVVMDSSGNILNWTKKKAYKRSQGL